MVPANEMPPVSEGNQNCLSDKMQIAPTTECNHNFQASSSLGQASLVDDELHPILEDARPDSSDNENHDANSHNEQLDEQTSKGISSKRKRYHRHTQSQIQEMESFFKQCPHPNEKQRKELGRDLRLDPLQVKFWFQNKRTQIKAQLERKENAQLRARNEKLQTENAKLKQTISASTCSNCGNPRADEISSEEHQLRSDNARLTQEIERLSAMVKTIVGNISKYTLTLPLNQGSVDFGAKTFGGEPDDVFSCNQPYRSLNCLSEQDISFLIEHAVSAAEEVAVMVRVGEPLWIRDLHRDKLVLNEQEYFKTFQKGFAPKQEGFVSEASRDSAIVMMSPLTIVEMFMELNKWLGVFSGMISKAKLYEVVSTGSAGSYNGAMQVISSEFRVLSLVVPTRECDFARYCKKLNEETWIVVDVSVDPLRFKCPMSRCHRRPCGCIIQAMPHGCSKISWVEHAEVPDQIIHSLSRSIISSGYAYGAKRWVSILKRQCERLACAMDVTNHPYIQDLNKIALTHPESKRNVLKLAERMVLNFYGGVTASTSTYHWTTVIGNGVDEVRIMTRKTINDPGRPGGVVLCASICLWIPVLPKIVFDYLQNESNRSEWDVLSSGGSVQEMAHIGNGQESGNCITLLKVTNPHEDQGDMLILQESSTEPTASFIVYAPVDVTSVNNLFGGGDPETVKLLPSGFTILPSGPPGFKGGIDDSTFTNGTLLSVAFQILVDSDPHAKLSVSSVATVSNLIESTIDKIKFALGVFD